jgi:ABC-type bacteriocin/lantibiotic exporter with double-glycine peptidase domain
VSSLHLSNAHCFASWLSQLGVSVHPQRLLELSQGKISPRFIARTLRAHGESVRTVAASDAALRNLTLPTLLQLEAGEVCILRELSDGQALIERGQGGTQQVALSGLLERVTLAFERGPRVELSGSFVTTLVAVITQQHGLLLHLLAVTLGVAGLGFLSPWLTREVMAHALGERAPSLLASLVLALVLASVMRAWLSWLRTRARLSMETHLTHAAGQFLFRRVLALPYAEHQARGLGELLQALGAGEVLSRTVAQLGVGPVLDVLLALAYLIALAISAPVLAGALLVLALLGALVSLLLSRRFVTQQARELEQSSRSRARLHELLSGIATVKAEHAERQGLVRWLDTMLHERALSLGKELTQSTLALWLVTVERVGRVGVLAWSAHAVMVGDLTVPDLVYVGMLCEGFLSAVSTLSQTATFVWGTRAHLARVDGVVSVEPVPNSGYERPRQLPKGPAIQLSDVWFRYGPDKPWILRGYNLTVQQGEQLTLRGPSGMGKTTVLRLFAGLYRPERGTVSVLGQDPARQRGALAYLPQQAQLLSGSLRDNLEQLSGASLERVSRACQLTGIEQWIATLPMKLETVVSPGGGNLSGGQRQWVVLTAAAASERPVLLMDESLSQLDNVVRQKLKPEVLFAGKTTVSVAHD